MMSCLDKNNKHFDYQYQNIIIVKELHNCFCEMYLGVKKTIFMMNHLLLQIYG